MLFYGISLIMKEKSNASALHAGADTAAHRPSDARLCSQMRSSLLPATVVSAPACADSRYWRGGATRDDARTCGEGLGRSTVAHFARKVRGTNIGAARHGLKIQQSNAPEC